MLKLDDLLTDAPASGAVLAPITGDDDMPATLTVGGVELGVCRRGGTGDIVLARYRDARPATDTRPERPAGWVATSRVSDFARAVAGGLLT